MKVFVEVLKSELFFQYMSCSVCHSCMGSEGGVWAYKRMG